MNYNGMKVIVDEALKPEEAYQMGDQFIVSPAVYEQLKKIVPTKQYTIISVVEPLPYTDDAFTENQSAEFAVQRMSFHPVIMQILWRLPIRRGVRDKEPKGFSHMYEGDPPTRFDLDIAADFLEEEGYSKVAQAVRTAKIEPDKTRDFSTALWNEGK